MRAYIGILVLLIAGFPAANAQNYSPNLLGTNGLNIIPSARFDETGTIRLNLSTLDPYQHTSVGAQITDPLYINVRQTAEVSSLLNGTKRLYPALDFKLKLLDENRSRPAMALGVNSAIGHKKTASEYITLSKRWKNFDFTGGLGWGRYASGGNIDNPLKFLPHFNKDREFNGEENAQVSDWFTGEKIGLLGGIEYFTPIKGLSLKLDYNQDNYTSERLAGNFEKPPSWSAGLSYNATDWLNISIGTAGTEKIFGRLNFKSNILNQKPEKTENPSHLLEKVLGFIMPFSNFADTIPRITQTNEKHVVLHLDQGWSTPSHIRRAVQYHPELRRRMMLTPRRMNLHGYSIEIPADTIHQSETRKTSNQEIWHKTSFTKNVRPDLPDKFLSHTGFNGFSLNIINNMSFAEEDNSLLFRNSEILSYEGIQIANKLNIGGAIRVNAIDNLPSLDTTRAQKPNPVRSDVDDFAENPIAIENLHLTYTNSFTPNLHMVATAGYLEEMYAGFGGEILYRPYGKRYAIGAQAWHAYKRDPNSDLNWKLADDNNGFTAHIQGWYDIPAWDATVSLKAGRYLAGDEGATMSLTKTFKNNASIEAFATLTNQNDTDPFGNNVSAYQGLKFTIPFGKTKEIPMHINTSFSLEPLGRDAGQTLKTPVNLYEATKPFSAAHMIRHWDDITPDYTKNYDMMETEEATRYFE